MKHEQLNLFKDSDFLSYELRKTKEQLNNVRRGLFKRHTELQKELSSLKEDFVKVIYLLQKKERQ